MDREAFEKENISSSFIKNAQKTALESTLLTQS